MVFVTGLFVLWLSCFVANNVERLETPAELVPQRNTTKIVEEETTNQTVLIENVTVTTPMVRIVNVTRCTNETIIFDFDKSCFSFFTVSTNFFTTVFALLHLENISSKPRIRWLMCVMLCYGMGIVAHMSFYHTHFESTLVISASIIGAVWAVLLVGSEKMVCVLTSLLLFGCRV